MREPELSPIIEGVESTFVARAMAVRVVVTADALKRDLGASDDVQSWLAAFKRHAQAIERAALEVHNSTGKTTIVLQFLASEKRH